jgi:uncharacterized protein YdhG (YjbR/CyaY superfamily)
MRPVATDPRVDTYLASLPPAQQAALQRVRETVGRLVPEATELISYGMPAFKLDGRFLVSYAGWKSHCSVYPLTDAFQGSHADELAAFDRTKGSVHFTPEAPLSDTLLEDLIRERVADVRSGAG